VGTEIVSALLLAALLATTPATPAPDEIVVTATKWKCEYHLASRLLSNRELDARAKEWALGKPVRIVTPAAADRKCLTKIAFELADRGVRLIEFVDPEDDR
jgi:hypothetical protein